METIDLFPSLFLHVHRSSSADITQESLLKMTFDQILLDFGRVDGVYVSFLVLLLPLRVTYFIPFFVISRSMLIALMSQ
jgi:hypothetical protein